MFTVLTSKYPNLRFAKHWELTKNAWSLLGQCEVYTRTISNAPIQPRFRGQMVSSSFVKAAHFSTAIEDNILSEDEVAKAGQNENVSENKKYYEKEAQNLVKAYRFLDQEIPEQKEEKNISISLIKSLHVLAGKDLGEAFGAVPGEYRNFSKNNLKYRCADHEDIEILMHQLSEWLVEEFNYKRGQEYSEIVLEALVAHIYLLWIRPFADGNGPTSRLLENYILLRGGIPPICSHVLVQHYSASRTEYFRQIENASVKRDLNEFIEYALFGLRNGLRQTLETIQANGRQVTWAKCVYDFFNEHKIGHESVALRMRRVAMSMEPDKKYRLDEMKNLNAKIAAEYATLSPLTLERDLNKLISVHLLLKDDAYYRPNTIENIAKIHYF